MGPAPTHTILQFLDTYRPPLGSLELEKKLCPRHAYTTILFTVCIAGWSELHVLEYFIVVCVLKLVETASTRVGLVGPLEYMKKEMLHGGSNPTRNRTQ